MGVVVDTKEIKKRKKMKMVIDTDKICSLNMNLNANSGKLNGFCPLFRNQNGNRRKRQGCGMNIALPTLKQTAASNAFMPGLEAEKINLVSSGTDHESTESSTSNSDASESDAPTD